MTPNLDDFDWEDAGDNASWKAGREREAQKAVCTLIVCFRFEQVSGVSIPRLNATFENFARSLI